MRRVFVSTALFVGVVQLLAACTLTSDPFKPQSFVRGLGSDAGEGPVVPGPSPTPDAGVAPGSSCGGSSELPGCDLPLTPLAECESDVDCTSQVCALGTCAAPSCSDGRQNGGEAGVDCGPGCDMPCAPVTRCEEDAGCSAGVLCQRGADCASRVCGDDGRCAAPTCDDDVHNQDEAAVDCGGGCPDDCVVGQACGEASDCQTGVCAASACPAGVERCCQSPSCNDGVRNGTEPVIDCGDAACGPCANDAQCTNDSQCASGLCASGVCRAPACDDESQNGTESDIDCGGACGVCAAGLGCNTDADCESAVCQDGRCCGGRELHCTRCARRLAGVLTCELSSDPVARDTCNAFLDCLANNPAACPVRHAAGCSEDPGGVCNHTAFGGNGGPGVVLADSILGTASCFF